MAREQERTQGGQGQVESQDQGQPRLRGSQGLKEIEGIADGEEGQGLALVGEGAPVAELARAQAGEGEEAQGEEVAAEVAEEEALAGQEPAGEGQERHEHHGGRGEGRAAALRRRRSWEAANRPRGHASHEGARRHVRRDHAARGHEGLAAHRHPREHRGSRPHEAARSRSARARPWRGRPPAGDGRRSPRSGG